MRKKLLSIVTALCLTAIPTKVLAKNGTWLLCDDGGLVLNIVKEKPLKSNLMMVIGGIMFSGILKGKDEGAVELKNRFGSFKGTVKITPTGNKAAVAVNGHISLMGETSPVNAMLVCKAMENTI
jgi:hypothetical protein